MTAAQRPSGRSERGGTFIPFGVEPGDMTNVIVCCDGLDPAYLDGVDTPSWDAIAAAGRSGTCECVVPSLTNVNNVSIVTGTYPRTHGVTGNTYYDSDRGEQVYMEDPSYLRCETRLESAADGGERVGALVAKEKLRRMVGRGCTLAASAESPPERLEDAVGPAPDIYSADASRWLLEAASAVLETRDLDWFYVSTTDVIPHKHAPGEPRATEWVSDLDGGLGAVAERADDVVVTADHGMSTKETAVDLDSILAEAGYDATVVHLIRDRHTYHHRNLGGAAYVYVDDPAGAADALQDVDGIDRVLREEDAASAFGLPPDRIGDLFVLGTEAAVFGPVEGDERTAVDLRSHGSHHEQDVPYAATVDVDLDANWEAFGALSGFDVGSEG